MTLLVSYQPWLSLLYVLTYSNVPYRDRRKETREQINLFLESRKRANIIISTSTAKLRIKVSASRLLSFNKVQDAVVVGTSSIFASAPLHKLDVNRAFCT